MIGEKVRLMHNGYLLDSTFIVVGEYKELLWLVYDNNNQSNYGIVEKCSVGFELPKREVKHEQQK